MAVLFKNVHSMLGVNPAFVDSEAQFTVGQTVQEDLGADLVYCKVGSGGVAAGDVAYLDASHVATGITTSNGANKIGWQVAVALTTALVDQFAWFVRGGKAEVKVAASCAAGVKINTTATAGQLDDDATTGARVIEGISLLTANGGAAGLVAAWVNKPYIGATL